MSFFLAIKKFKSSQVFSQPQIGRARLAGRLRPPSPASQFKKITFSGRMSMRRCSPRLAAARRTALFQACLYSPPRVAAARRAALFQIAVGKQAESRLTYGFPIAYPPRALKGSAVTPLLSRRRVGGGYHNPSPPATAGREEEFFSRLALTLYLMPRRGRRHGRRRGEQKNTPAERPFTDGTDGEALFRALRSHSTSYREGGYER